MYAILSVIEKLTSKGIMIFIEATLITHKNFVTPGEDDVHLSERVVIEMLPTGANINANNLKLALINHYTKQGYVLSAIETGSLVEDRREINFYLQVPDDNEYRSKES